MSRRAATGAAALLLAALPPLAGCGDAAHRAAPSPPPPAAAAEVAVSEEHRIEVERWREQRRERLAAADGWLTLVGLEWLEPGRNRLGSDPAAEIQFPAPAPALLATIERRGAALTLTPAAGVELLAGEAPVSGPLPLASDAEGKPTLLRHGTFLFYVIQRGDRWAVRIKDSASPVRTTFQGLDYYPLSGDWRVTARFEPSPPGTTIPVPNILGTIDASPSPGAVVFTHQGREARLLAVDEGDGRLFLVFGDTTNGKETYGGGRFVYADPPAPGESTVVVDFNKSYNPPCVFTPYATCPLPPRENKLPFPIAAGEKLWAGYQAAQHPPAAPGG